MKIYHEITQKNMVIHTFNCNLCCGYGIEPGLKWNSISWRIEFLALEKVEKMTNWLKGIEPHTFTAVTIISITLRKLFYSRFSWPIERVPSTVQRLKSVQEQNLGQKYPSPNNQRKKIVSWQKPTTSIVRGR